MNPKVAQIITEQFRKLEEKIAGLVVNAVSLPFQLATNTLKTAWSNVKGFNELAVSTSREIGMNWKQSIGYTQVLIERTKDLAMQYGVTAEQIGKMESAMASATGKALVFTGRDVEKYVAISKLIGESSAAAYGAAFSRSLGGSIGGALDTATKAYAKATQHGLAASKFSAEVAKNLGLANRISFSQGVDGIARMTAISEKLGFNLSSIEGVVGHFSDFQDAISNSAKLQGLGGMAGIMGSNPLTMMYESLNDVESLTERITMMTRGLATFNEKTGIADLRGMNLEMTRYIADALGMSREEVATIARNVEKERYFEAHAANALSMAGDNQAMRDWLINKGQYDAETHSIRVQTGLNGETTDVRDLTPEALEEIWRESSMSNEEAVRQSAREITTLTERVAAIQQAIGAMLAEKLLPALGVVQQFLVQEGIKIAEIVGRGLTLLINPSFWKTSFAWMLGGIVNAINPLYHLFGIGDMRKTDWYKNMVDPNILKEVGSIKKDAVSIFNSGKAMLSQEIPAILNAMSQTGKADFTYNITDQGDVYPKPTASGARQAPQRPAVDKQAERSAENRAEAKAPTQADNNGKVLVINNPQGPTQASASPAYAFNALSGLWERVTGRANQQVQAAQGQQSPSPAEAANNNSAQYATNPTQNNQGGQKAQTQQTAKGAEAAATSADVGEEDDANKKHKPNIGAAALSTLPWLFVAKKTYPVLRFAASAVKSLPLAAAGLALGGGVNYLTNKYAPKTSKKYVAGKTIGRALQVAGIGAQIGSFIAPGIGTAIGGAIGAIGGGIWGWHDDRKEKKAAEAEAKAKANAVKEVQKTEAVMATGDVGQVDISRYGVGTSSAPAFGRKNVQTTTYNGYSGGVANDYITQRPVSTPQVATAIGDNTETVKTVTARQQDGKITFSDLNINVGGEITLNMPNGTTANVDTTALFNNPSFTKELTELVSRNLTAAMNGGRSKWDVSAHIGANPVSQYNFNA